MDGVDKSFLPYKDKDPNRKRQRAADETEDESDSPEGFALMMQKMESEDIDSLFARHDAAKAMKSEADKKGQELLDQKGRLNVEESYNRYKKTTANELQKAAKRKGKKLQADAADADKQKLESLQQEQREVQFKLAQRRYTEKKFA